VIQEGDLSEEIKDLHILYRTKREINGRKRKRYVHMEAGKESHI